MGRIEAEIEYGKRIQEDAERVWGWSSWAGQRRAERRAGLLRDLGCLGQGATCLEVGCGVGIFTEKLAETGAELTAIDISPDLVERARRRVSDTRVRVEVMNAEATTFGGDTFDSIVGSSILHHLNVEVALKEFWRILRPEGRLVVSEPNMLNPLVCLIKNVPFLKRWHGDLPHETAFLRWSIARALRRAGFRAIRIRPYDFLHPSTPRVLVGPIDKLGLWLERIPVVREFAGSLIIVAKKPLSVHSRGAR